MAIALTPRLRDLELDVGDGGGGVFPVAGSETTPDALKFGTVGFGPKGGKR